MRGICVGCGHLQAIYLKCGSYAEFVLHILGRLTASTLTHFSPAEEAGDGAPD